MQHLKSHRLQAMTRALKDNVDRVMECWHAVDGLLHANTFINAPGVKLHGASFIGTREEIRQLELVEEEGMERFIREYCKGSDLADSPCSVLVVDVFGPATARVRMADDAIGACFGRCGSWDKWLSQSIGTLLAAGRMRRRKNRQVVIACPAMLTELPVEFEGRNGSLNVSI